MARLELKKCPYCGSEVDTVSVKEKDGNLCIEVKAKNIPAANQWIPCSERLPEKTGYYLVCDSTAEFDNVRGRQDVSKFVIGRHGGHWYGAIRGEYITHWMPLPEPPESEVQDDGDK